MLGKQRAASLLFIASDMWKAFRQVVRQRCSGAIHLLDRFHVMQLMSRAIDLTRRDEMRQLRAKGKHAILTKTRWILLKNPRNFTDSQRGRMRELLQCNLKTGFALAVSSQPAPPLASTTKRESRPELRTVFAPTNTPKSRCTIASQRYPSPLGSPSPSC
jgi:transposase